MDPCSCGIFRQSKSSPGSHFLSGFLIALTTRMPVMFVGKMKMHSFFETRVLSSSLAILRIVLIPYVVHLELNPIDAAISNSIGNSRITGLLALPFHREWVVLTTQLIIRIAMTNSNVKQFPSNHLPEVVRFVETLHFSFLPSDAE